MAGKNGARRLWRAGRAVLLPRAPSACHNKQQQQQQKQATALVAKQSATWRSLRALIGALRRGRALVRDAVSAACSEHDPSAEVHEPSPPPGYVQFSCSSTPSSSSSSSSSARGDCGGFRRHLLGAKRHRRSRDGAGSPFQLAAGGRAQQQVDRLAEEFICRFYDHLHAEAVAAAIARRSSC